MDNEYTVIGKPRPIGDAALKVTGQKIYVGDMELPGMQKPHCTAPRLRRCPE